jgi:peptidoglycan/xylan/chitin deacetylase (PgdA/CDA1 family)
MINAFSVDVEDWYQVSDFESAVDFSAWDRYESRVLRNTERVLGLLDERGVKGTFFVLTWNAERHPEVVRRIADQGHEIASHGYRTSRAPPSSATTSCARRRSSRTSRDSRCGVIAPRPSR